MKKAVGSRDDSKQPFIYNALYDENIVTPNGREGVRIVRLLSAIATEFT